MSASKVAAPDTITDMPPAMLVSATYDAPSKSAILKFYEPGSQNIILWKDATDHKPYCYSILSPDEIRAELGPRSDVLAIEPTNRRDLSEDKEITVSKIVVDDPLAIGGTTGPKSIRNILADTWESDIKYYENYLYDRSLIVGKHYTIRDSQVHPQDQDISEDVQLALKSLIWDKITDEEMADTAQFQEFISEWAHLLNQPIPEIRRVAVDIEVEAVEGRIPDPKIAENTVTAVGFDGTDNLKQVFVLDTGIQKGTDDLDPEVRVTFYSDEKSMILDAFKIISDAPFVVTYNGDEFDLPYLYNRARRLGIPDGDNPLYMMRNSATLRRGVHIDLYRTMSNRSFQIYAFSQKYTSFSLNSVSEALLGERKIDYGKALGELTLYETANYCYNDARLTLKLTTFNNNLLMNLLVIIARIGRMPVDDIARMGVSQWIRSLLYYEHRRMNAIIPRQKELTRRTPEEVATDAVIKDKKFRGGLVIEPVGGVHFDVIVMDFASLYPSIIKVRNISYETVRCPHPECQANKIPQTNHWVCGRKNGITAMIIGSLRDLRVNYYKALSKSPTLTEEERQQYVVVTQALKVILNASYGVMGAEIFPLYFLPAAETTTAIGRHIIQGTSKMCEDAGIKVLYGDTDSLFLKEPTDDQIRGVMEAAKREYGVDLEVEKEYRYCVLSNLKKNYFGVTKLGKVDVKGLTGKKSHTPPFIKKLFEEIVIVLSRVHSMTEFEQARAEVSSRIAESGRRLEAREIPVDELAFNMTMSKAPSEYTKTVPQHVRAARLLESEEGREIKRGETISYIKTRTKLGVKPASMARADEVDPAKYLEFMESTLGQITSPMGLDFDEALGKPKQTGLDQFFWG